MNCCEESERESSDATNGRHRKVFSKQHWLYDRHAQRAMHALVAFVVTLLCGLLDRKTLRCFLRLRSAFCSRCTPPRFGCACARSRRFDRDVPTLAIKLIASATVGDGGGKEDFVQRKCLQNVSAIATLLKLIMARNARVIECCSSGIHSPPFAIAVHTRTHRTARGKYLRRRCADGKNKFGNARRVPRIDN